MNTPEMLIRSIKDNLTDNENLFAATVGLFAYATTALLIIAHKAYFDRELPECEETIAIENDIIEEKET